MLMVAEPTMRRPQDRQPFNRPTGIPVVVGPQLRSGTRSVVGFMPVGVLIPDNYAIPYYDTRTRQGYQRQPQESRINQLANDLRRDRTDLPTAVLLNIRNREALEAVSESEINLTRLWEMSVATPKFYVVDGQHRILALQKLIDDDADRWTHFMLPFVCLIGANEDEEMNQFYIVNSTAKSVKTDLAYALLRRRAEGDPDVYEALQERGREWQVSGQKLVERLATESPIWQHRIRLPGLPKDQTTIPSASMVASLKPLLSSPYFGGLKPDQQLVVIDAFWRGIKELLPSAFDDPTKFVIQKGMGVIVMHTLLPYVLELVRSQGLSTVEPDSYRQVLHGALNKLEGENASGEVVRAIEFWASAPKGAAGSFSSSAGRRVLTAKIRQLLPSVTVE